jgi:hypothetical protein
VVTPLPKATAVKITAGLLVVLLAAGILHDLFPASAALIAAALVPVVVGIGICAVIAFGQRLAFLIYAVLCVGFLFQLAVSATMLHSTFAGFVWNATLRATVVAAILVLFSQLARRWLVTAGKRAVFNSHIRL